MFQSLTVVSRNLSFFTIIVVFYCLFLLIGAVFWGGFVPHVEQLQQCYNSGSDRFVYVY